MEYVTVDELATVLGAGMDQTRADTAVAATNQLIDAWTPPAEDIAGPVEVYVEGLTATFELFAGPANTHFRYSFGDGSNGDVTTDAGGYAELTHTYGAAGTYHVTASGDAGVVAEGDVTVGPGIVTGPSPALRQAALELAQTLYRRHAGTGSTAGPDELLAQMPADLVAPIRDLLDVDTHEWGLA